MPAMRIPNLADLIANCWNRAESALLDTIKEKFPDADEETVTILLHGELRSEFNKANEKRTVEAAFRRDLQLSGLGGRASYFPDIARGLIATVSFHPREVERKTGGDFGLVLDRPNVDFARFTRSRLTISDHRRGLLCQAKIFGRSSKWNKPTKNQRQVLADKLQYLALVLYRYSDQDGERRHLAPIEWQLTDQATMNEIDAWLASDSFPRLQRSSEIINNLSNDKIGTADKIMIAEFVAPRVRPSLEIVIRWADGRGPGSEVQMKTNTAQSLKLSIER